MAEHLQQTQPPPAPRARPVIEMNLNLDEAIVETVELIRTVRVQLASISNTLGQSLNRTVADVGDDIGRIISNVEAISRNVAESTGQLYQPLLLFLLFLLIIFILLTILFCIIFRTQREMRRLSGARERNGEEGDEGEGRDGGGAKRRRSKRKNGGGTKSRASIGKRLWWGRRTQGQQEDGDEEEQRGQEEEGEGENEREGQGGSRRHPWQTAAGRSGPRGGGTNKRHHQNEPLV